MLTHGNPIYRIGDATVTRIDEIGWDDADPARLYPDLDAAALAEYGGKIGPGSYDAATGRLALRIHTWLVRHHGRTVLVDTGMGNGTSHPDVPLLHNLDTPYIERLAAAGVRPEQVDRVLLTHIHSDHIGWNTMRRGDGRVPTFPNARYVFSRTEQRYAASLAGDAAAPDLPPPEMGPPDHPPAPGFYAPSIRPLIEAGVADAIEADGADIGDGFSYHPTPGHSVDHASLRLRSNGDEAWFLGDVIHHPLQVYRPDLRTVYCEFPGPAEASRRRMLETAADRGATCFTTHMAETSAGRVTRRGNEFAWSFL